MLYNCYFLVVNIERFKKSMVFLFDMDICYATADFRDVSHKDGFGRLSEIGCGVLSKLPNGQALYHVIATAKALYDDQDRIVRVINQDLSTGLQEKIVSIDDFFHLQSGGLVRVRYSPYTTPGNLEQPTSEVCIRGYASMDNVMSYFACEELGSVTVFLPTTHGKAVFMVSHYSGNTRRGYFELSKVENDECGYAIDMMHVGDGIRIVPNAVKLGTRRAKEDFPILSVEASRLLHGRYNQNDRSSIFWQPDPRLRVSLPIRKI